MKGALGKLGLRKKRSSKKEKNKEGQSTEEKQEKVKDAVSCHRLLVEDQLMFYFKDMDGYGFISECPLQKQVQDMFILAYHTDTHKAV